MSWGRLLGISALTALCIIAVMSCAAPVCKSITPPDTQVVGNMTFRILQTTQFSTPQGNFEVMEIEINGVYCYYLAELGGSWGTAGLSCDWN
jgi:hypothetical protein